MKTNCIFRTTQKFFPKFFSFLRHYLSEIIVVLIALILFTTVFAPGRIPSGSMEPTLNIGDIAITNNLAYISKAPQRGDIVTLQSDATGNKTLIKRIVGLPGDSMMFIEGQIYINGKRILEDYLPAGIETESFKDFEVPAGHYFVMGDNRSNSYDSRHWINPYVPAESIHGKMYAVIPLSHLYKALGFSPE